MTGEPEPKCAAAERTIVEEAPVEALASDSATIAVVEETAVTARDVDERWPRLPRIGEQHHFPRGDSSSSSFWSSTSSLWSSTTSSLRSWASSSSASSLLSSFSAAPAQGDGPDHYRPDSPDDFRVACRDVSMPLPEGRLPIYPTAHPENLIVITSCCTVK